MRLLSRRIIIRLFDDVKKKVQKNLRARTNRSTSRAHVDRDTIDTHTDLDFHTIVEVPLRGVCAMSRHLLARINDMRSRSRCTAASNIPTAREQDRFARFIASSDRLESRMSIGFHEAVR